VLGHCKKHSIPQLRARGCSRHDGDQEVCSKYRGQHGTTPTDSC
jgi:hypothetical protein